jgi:hypothetical protein
MNDSERLDTLQEMLMYKRPEGSKTERKFINRYIKPLGVGKDGAGNLIKRIGESPVLWSCHTDTVHNRGGKQAVERAGDLFGLAEKGTWFKGSNCLGADDTAGVWLMSEMIKAKTPGLYIFHRGEEIGGVGSKFIANKTPDLLKGIKYAIALDRSGANDVITHQWGRCASDDFADSLASGLNTGTGLRYKRDPAGIFTDTANYVDLVPECTNLSVGYRGAHSANEIQDGAHCLALREALIGLDTSTLVESRKAGEDGGYSDWEKRYYDLNYTSHEKADYTCYGSTTTTQKGWTSDVWDEGEQSPPRHRTLLGLVKDYPEEVADWLESYGVDETEMRSYIADIRRWNR